MQFSTLSLFTLLAAGLASANGEPIFQGQLCEGGVNINSLSPEGFIKRQRPDTGSPAMTDKDGNVIAFDAANVYLPSQNGAK